MHYIFEGPLRTQPLPPVKESVPPEAGREN